jgi:DNA-binding NarL/FixJ family response regulator
MTEKMKLLIVDDHALFREGLASILRSEPDIEIIGLAGSVKEAQEVVHKTRPDIALMDFSLPDGTGVEATRLILAEHPDCKVIFLTMSEEDETLFEAVRCGAKGYLLKNMRPSKLIVSIRAVHKGESAISRSMTLRLMEEFSRIPRGERPTDPTLARLTPRELDVLRLLSNRFSNQEIAEKLVLSENTVKYHVHSILDKLNLKDRISAANYARQHGLLK